MRRTGLDLDDIQGDILEGLQTDSENFIFFKLVDTFYFKRSVKQHIVNCITSAEQVHRRSLEIRRRQNLFQTKRQPFQGLNLGLSKDGLIRLLGILLPPLDPAFERGADHPKTIATLHDPLKSRWLARFVAERIDGVFLVTGPDRRSATAHSNELLRLLGASIKVVYSEIGNTRPGAERGHEHFGFLDNISQPGIRGLTPSLDPVRRPDQGLPGQDLLWPGEFVFGYPGQHPEHPTKEGPPPAMAAPWMSNSSYMVFRRLEQKVPEFRRFVQQQVARLGMDRQLLAARMVGRWRSGAPLELAPLRDNPGLGGDDKRNNDFGFGDDRFQRKLPLRRSYSQSLSARRPDPGGGAEASHYSRRHPVRPGGRAGRDDDPAEPGTDVCVLSDIDRAAVRVHPDPLRKRPQLCHW
jgi:deferrochelatase/peroxidase EfeB